MSSLSAKGRFGVYTNDDLYVMQNEHGLIKIGRSIDPEFRRRQLQKQDKCKVEIVVVLSERGRREQAVHRALKIYRIEEEWFEGNDAARAAVTRTLRAGELQWPFPLAEVESEEWIERLCARRYKRYCRANFARVLMMLKGCGVGWVADSRSYELFWFSLSNQWITIDVHDENGRTVLDAYRGDDVPPFRIPLYSEEVDLALSLWPDGTAPPSWNGTALECCIAALEAWKVQLFPRTRAKI